MPLSLSQINQLVVETVQHGFSQEQFHIVAEISEIAVRSSGHCYLDFIEKDDTLGIIAAKAPAHIWRSRWTHISQKFSQVTGERLRAGMKILATVEVDMHAVYGYSLNVIDIDPSYTIGEKAARRDAVIRQLRQDGLFDSNKELYLPRPVRRIAIVSSRSAAGYEDFCRQIEQSGYFFELSLHEAVMQGDGAVDSIIDALTSINDACTYNPFDIAIIIRGGGGSSDLACFDDYYLASRVVTMDIPVWTGIGHERDTCVLDLVAHHAFKTPTAVASYLVDQRSEEYRLLDELSLRLEKTITARLQNEQLRLRQLGSRLQLSATHTLHHAKLRIEANAIQLRDKPTQRIRQERTRLDALQKQLSLLHPQRILDRGYSLTTKEGAVVYDAQTLQAGDTLLTHFKKGRITTVVKP